MAGHWPLLLVGAAGIEPATTGLEIRCSIHLSYAPTTTCEIPFATVPIECQCNRQAPSSFCHNRAWSSFPGGLLPGNDSITWQTNMHASRIFLT